MFSQLILWSIHEDDNRLHVRHFFIQYGKAQPWHVDAIGGTYRYRCKLHTGEWSLMSRRFITSKTYYDKEREDAKKIGSFDRQPLMGNLLYRRPNVSILIESPE
mgnify:CR=1 FL=1